MSQPITESATAIIAYYWQKSHEYAKKAKDMEKEFLAEKILRAKEGTDEKLQVVAASVERVACQLLVKTSARPADIAEALGESREAVLKTLESDPTKFLRAGQGWFQLTAIGRTFARSVTTP